MNISKDQKILVAGATGKQGGAVAGCLLRDGWGVRILTRNPNKPAARQCASQGCEVFQGDMDDSNSLERAIEGCHGVFSVQDFYQAGAEGEVRQGKAIADAAKAAGVKHFVYSSVGSADRDTGIPHFETKFQIEQHVRSINLPWTIVRPVFFMDNFTQDWLRPGIFQGKLALAMQPDRPLQMIAVSDIGECVAMCFARMDQFLSKAIDLAGDELTMPKVAEKLSQVIGRRVVFQPVSIDEVQASSPELAKMYDWFNKVGYNVNIANLRQMLPDLKTFDTYLADSVFAKEPVTAGSTSA